MTTKTFRSDGQGRIASLEVIGYHGRLSEPQTPARRGPVYADEKGHQVRFIEANPLQDGGFSVIAEVTSRKIPAETWAATGTRISTPWPVVLDDIIAIVGPRELKCAHELARRSLDTAPDLVSSFLRWLTTTTERSDDLRCARIGDFVAWYCKPEHADALFARIADVARDQLFEAVGSTDRIKLKDVSFWLSRAAIEDDDIYLAAAGLRRSGNRHWQELVHAGVRTGTKTQRLAAVDGADERLEELIDLSVAPGSCVGFGRCPGCGGYVHWVIAGSDRWQECTHGCGWVSPWAPAGGAAGLEEQPQ